MSKFDKLRGEALNEARKEEEQKKVNDETWEQFKLEKFKVFVKTIKESIVTKVESLIRRGIPNGSTVESELLNYAYFSYTEPVTKRHMEAGKYLSGICASKDLADFVSELNKDYYPARVEVYESWLNAHGLCVKVRLRDTWFETISKGVSSVFSTEPEQMDTLLPLMG